MENELTYVCETGSPEETKRLASALAACLREGDVTVLSGDLGAGKTQFVQGVAAGLGVGDAVTSPTFNILLSYRDGKLPLYHLDLYRLEDASELEDIDYFSLIDGDGDGAVFVEWAEKFPEELPDDYLEVAIRAQGSSRRRLTARSHGPRSRELLASWTGGSPHVFPNVSES